MSFSSRKGLYVRKGAFLLNGVCLLKNLRISDENREPIDIAMAGGTIIAIGKSLHGGILEEKIIA